MIIPVKPASTSRQGFTLVELLAVLVLTAGVASVTTPIILAASEAFASAAAQRDSTESASMAVDRLVRMIRAIPDGSEDAPGVPAISSFSAGSLVLNDGTAVTLSGTSLELTLPGTAAAPLCTQVTAFEFTYYGDDGMVLDLAAAPPQQSVRSIGIHLVRSGAVELRTRAFLRCTLGAQ